MTPKFTIPPLMPSAEERGEHAISVMTNFHTWAGVSDAIDRAHRDGYLAGIDAVIAALREPDAELIAAMRRAYDATEGKTEDEAQRAVALALADELERRRP